VRNVKYDEDKDGTEQTTRHGETEIRKSEIKKKEAVKRKQG